MKDNFVAKSNSKEIKRNYVTWNRSYVVIKRHSPIIRKSLIFSLVVESLWKYTIFDCNLAFGKEAENSILFIILMFSALTYVIFASWTINTVLGELKKLSKAVIKKDMDAFLLLRDEQLPILIHLLLIVTSIFFLFFTIMYPYTYFKQGAAIIFAVSYLIIFIHLTISELDYCENSIWFQEKVPPAWWEVDIEEYFKSKIEAGLKNITQTV